MATAYIDWSNDGNCEWGLTPLDWRNYSCAVSGNGLHDIGYDRSVCYECGGQEAYCIECGTPMCGCVTDDDAVELV